MIPGMGTRFGEVRLAEIIRYDSFGNVTFRIDGESVPREFTCPMPLSWSGPDGEFIGGEPQSGSRCLVVQAKGGSWYVLQLVHNRDIFRKNSNLRNLVKSGRAVISVKSGTSIYVDPKEGIVSGGSLTKSIVDPNLRIISSNAETKLEFDDSKLYVSGIIKRDLSDNTSRDLLNSTYDSVSYDKNLWQVGMDPRAKVSGSTIGDSLRNPPLTESREIVYEFSKKYNILSDAEESKKLTAEDNKTKFPELGRRDNRADALSLGLTYPNQLIETIKGTVVDVSGNILDINRSILPIGKIDELSLYKNDKKEEAYAKIRAQLRKSLAYHFEINTRKQSTKIESAAIAPNTDDTSDYSRNRSRFFLDIDKEGQFKMNVPASSETGNVPLPVRYENYSVLLANADENFDPKTFTRSSQDIYHDSFSSGANIAIKDSASHVDGYAAPNDRIKNEPIKLGTAYHDITSACNVFLSSYNGDIISYGEHNLNKIDKYEKLVSDSIVISGEDANAGGRSGSINLDGFISLSVGANTVDRQSAWFDYAGGIVSTIGRDKRGISYAAHLDGDMIIQVGGRKGLSKNLDSRFSEEDDGYKSGVVDIRVVTSAGLVTVFRIDSLGVSVATQGRMDFYAAQDINFTSDADIHLNGKAVRLYGDTGYGKSILRNPHTI